jgi:uncharacterized membrane protein YkoI
VLGVGSIPNAGIDHAPSRNRRITMRIARWIMPAACLGLLGAATATLADEKKIEISELPKAVVKAAKKAFPEAQIVGAAKETEDGETIYEVMMKLDGKSIDLAIDDEGEIEEIEKEIEVEDLPRAVIKAVRKKFPGSEIEKVEEVSDEDDKVVYELAIETKGGKTIEVVMSPNGKFLDDEDEEDEDDEKGEKAKKKDKDDEKGEKAKKKDKDDEKGEKAKKKDKDDDEEEEKGEKKKPKD